jgi:surface antigen
MKPAACMKLLALAIVTCSLGGRAEARAPSHSSHGAASHNPASHSSSAREASHQHSDRSLYVQGRFDRPAYVHEHADHPLYAHDHSDRPLYARDVAFRRGSARHAYWGTYGRSSHAAFGGRFDRHQGFSGGAGIQCVTFARADTGIELSGNASSWWDHAAGVYQRGNAPEPGSVLNFRANGAMRMGHVAVVSEVVDGRTVIIDHANWGGPGAVRGGVSRNISVVDVSPGNDWSAVRVALGHSGEYGSIYPTYGFIYNRPDRGTLVASADSNTAIPALNPPPRDLRSREQSYDEVAEAPDGPASFTPHHMLRHRHHYTVVTGRHFNRRN